MLKEKEIRVFVSSSHLSTLLMILYAQERNPSAYKDILILDSPPKKASLIQAIKGTRFLHDWAVVVDLSSVLTDGTEMVPGFRKSLTRKIKHWPIFKQLYGFLFSIKGKNRRRDEMKILSSQISPLGNVAEVNVLTQTFVNDSLVMLFPGARVQHFEHGLGDAYFTEKSGGFGKIFYTIFNDCIQAEGRKHNRNFDYVKPLPGVERFRGIAELAIEKNLSAGVAEKLRSVSGRVVIILLESMQIFEVPDHYYVDFLDLCLRQIPDPRNYTFILKPHPAQTFRSLQDSKRHLEDFYKVRTVELSSSAEMSFSVEALYLIWEKQADYVFTAYSSSIFYISILYGGSSTKFYYAYNFFSNYLKRAPKQFLDIYHGIGHLVEEVVSVHCVQMNDTPGQVGGTS